MSTKQERRPISLCTSVESVRTLYSQRDSALKAIKKAEDAVKAVDALLLDKFMDFLLLHYPAALDTQTFAVLDGETLLFAFSLERPFARIDWRPKINASTIFIQIKDMEDQPEIMR